MIANILLPIDDNNSYLKPEGTVYITNGTAGGSPQGVGGHDLPSMVFTSTKKMYNFAIMTVEGNSLKYVVYNDANDVIDSFQITK